VETVCVYVNFSEIKLARLMRLRQIMRFCENCIFYILFRHVFVTYHLLLDGLNFEVGVSVGVGEEFCPLRFLQFSRVILA